MKIEMAKDLNSSIMWKEVVEEIDKKVAYELSKLKTCKPEELGIIQAKVMCYESLTRLPADVIERTE